MSTTEDKEKTNNHQLLLQPFYILTSNLLTLLLPLSFLLLARLSCAEYYLTTRPSSSILFSIFLYTNPPLLYLLVSLLSITTLIHALTGKTTFLKPSHQSRLFFSWIFLCTLQLCVGLGIEESISTTSSYYESSGFGLNRSLLSRLVFFLGLHETTLVWFRTIVKPVVDDTVFECCREEKWVERVTLALSVGGLWWWKLRDEVESLVVIVEVKKELSMGLSVGDFVGWWLYYLTVTIGMVRVVKSLLWFAMVLLFRRRNGDDDSVGYCENDEKV